MGSRVAVPGPADHAAEASALATGRRADTGYAKGHPRSSDTRVAPTGVQTPVWVRR